MAEARAKKADLIIQRLLWYKSPFDALELPLDVESAAVTKRYKRLALYIHPDKCKDERAVNAFDALNKHVMTLENEDERRRFVEFAVAARGRIADEWTIAGRKRDEKETEFNYEVSKMTQKLIIETAAREAKREEKRLANEKYEKEKKIEDWELGEIRMEVEKEWEKGRDKRVGDWRDFQQTGKTKAEPCIPDPDDDVTIKKGKMKKKKESKRFTPTGIRPPRLKLVRD